MSEGKKAKKIFHSQQRTFPFFLSCRNHAIQHFSYASGGEEWKFSEWLYGSCRIISQFSLLDIFQTPSNIQRSSTAPKQHRASTPNLGKCVYVKRANQLNFYRSVKQSATTYFPFRFIEACTRSEVIERQTSEEENGKSYSNLTEWEREILKKVLRSGVKSEEKLHLFKQQSLNFPLHFCFASAVLVHREWGKFCLLSDDEWLLSGLGERRATHRTT